MPIFSRRFSLWTRLYQRMLLEPTTDARVTPMVSELVVPVLDADSILRTYLAGFETIDISVSTSTVVTAFTVPDGEEWKLITCVKPGTSSNSRVGVIMGGDNVYVSLASTSAQIIDLREYTLSEGMLITMQGTGNGGDASRSLGLVYSTIDLSS